MSNYINLSTYSAPIELDSSGLEKGLKKMDGDVKKKTDGIAKYMKVGLAGALTAIGTASAGLMAITTKSAEATDQIDKMSQKIGLSREGYQEWNFIMSQSGASVDGLQAGMKTLVGRMDEAINGTGKGSEAFDRLGLSATDASGAVKSQEQIFEETVIALQNMEEGSEKARLANELFGKSGSEMMPLLNGAAGSIEEMKDKAHELGLILSDDAIDAGVLFTDTMDQTKRMLASVTTTIGVGLMPMIQSFLEWVMQYMPEIQATFKFVFGIMESLVGGFVDTIFGLISWLHNWYDENEETVNNIKDSFMEFFSIVTEFFEAFILFSSALWDKFGTDIIAYTTTAFNMVKDVISGAFSIVEGLLKVFTGIFTGDWNKFTEGLKQVWSGLWEAIKSVVSNAWKLLLSPVFVTLYEDVKGWFVGLVSDAIQWGKDVVTGFADGIKEYAMMPLNAAKDMAKGVGDSVKNFFKIASPSKLMREYGMNIMEGLANGIESNGLNNVIISKLEEEIHRIQGEIDDLEEIEKSYTKWQIENNDKLHGDLKKRIENYSEWTRLSDIRNKIDALRREQEYYRDKIAIIQDRLREKRKILQNHYLDMDVLTNDSLATLLETTEGGWDTIHEYLTDKFESIKSEYEALIKSLSKPLPTPSSGYSGSGGGGGGSSSSGNSAEVFKGTDGSYYYSVTENGKTSTKQLPNKQTADGIAGGNTASGIKVEKKYHEGGWVGSMLGNLRHDEVPAILQQGEYILSKKMIQDIANANVSKQDNKSNGKIDDSKVENHYHISKLEFPNVKDGQDVLDALKGLPSVAIQHVMRI